MMKDIEIVMQRMVLLLFVVMVVSKIGIGVGLRGLCVMIVTAISVIVTAIEVLVFVHEMRITYFVRSFPGYIGQQSLRSNDNGFAKGVYPTL